MCFLNKNINAHQKARPNIRTEATGVSRSNICTNGFSFLLDLHFSFLLNLHTLVCVPRRPIWNVHCQVNVFYQPTHIKWINLDCDDHNITICTGFFVCFFFGDLFYKSSSCVTLSIGLLIKECISKCYNY